MRENIGNTTEITFSQASEDEVLNALRVLTKIEKAAVIVHGGAGCAASGIYFNEEKNNSWYTTGLNEKDTILGGDEKLRKAVIRSFEEQNPEVIFIVGTPVVAINNDDVNAIILELEDELGVKIVSIYTDGFKTKSPATGYDIVLHSLLRYVVDRTQGEKTEKEDFINVVSISENKRDFVEKVVGSLNLQEETINTFLQKEEETFRYYFQGIADSFFEEQVGKVIALVGDESTVLRIGTFAKEYLGAIIDVAVVTDGFPGEDGKIKKSEELKALANEVYFTQDGREIDNILVHSDVELILGSSLEDGAAKKKETVNLEISYPVYHKAILNKTYAGVNGALALTEDYISKVKEYNRLEEERLLQGIRK